MRQNFSVGQEIVSEDLNTLQSRVERGLYDRIIYELMGRKSGAFFQDGLKVLFQSSTAVTLKAGLGFQEIDTGTSNPFRKPVVNDADVTQNLDTPDGSNPRIDIVCVRHGRYNSQTESRNFKDEFTDVIAAQNTTVSTDWRREIQYVAGTPAAVPVIPATPAGWVKLAEILVAASTGVASQSSITDSRALLPIAVATTSTGSSEYDAIVGIIGTDQGANYATLKAALDNASDGWKILVLRSETINTIPVVLHDKIEIVFKRGVTFTKGTATKGIQVDGDDCKISGFRAASFNTVADSGIHVSVGAIRTVVDAPRFLACDTNVKDDGTDTFLNVVYSE